MEQILGAQSNLYIYIYIYIYKGHGKFAVLGALFKMYANTTLQKFIKKFFTAFTSFTFSAEKYSNH